MSLLEILVAIGIITVLTGLTLMSSRMIGESRKGATAKQQLMLLAAAINRYAEFWPPWKVVDGASEFRIAEKGWPDFLPGRLFPTGTVPAGSSSFTSVTNFNNYGPILTLPLQEWDLATLNRDLLSANECLVYALTSKAGKGPYIPHDSPNILDLRSYNGGIAEPLLPAPLGAGNSESRKVINDPWGTPIRYFWVYRDVESNSANRAYTGYLPVDYGAFTTQSNTPGSVGDPAFHQSDLNSTPKVAVGYVLESAGPNKRFGNIWKANPMQKEIDDAEDNITIRP